MNCDKIKNWIIIIFGIIITILTLGQWSKSKKVINDAKNKIKDIDKQLEENKKELDQIDEQLKDNEKDKISDEKLEELKKEDEQLQKENDKIREELKEGENNEKDDSVDDDYLADFFNSDK